MRHRAVRTAAMVAMAALHTAALAAQRSSESSGTTLNRPALRVAFDPGRSIRIDGRLDEPAWLTVDSIANLTQIEPVEGQAPSGRTVVRVVAESDALVFGIRADDPDPSQITSFSRNRDANLTNEDHIRLVLDTYLDGRSGYVFIVNPHGARFDALIANQGEGENAQWDAIWEAATHRSSTGWSAEIRIPAKSLLFRRGLTQWGFNVQRRVQRLLESSRWASPDRDVKINVTSRAGLLTGVPPFDLGAGLSIRPSLTASAGQPAPSTGIDTERDVSLDVTKRLGTNTLGSLTINTDFAETEVDTRRTNLTRFPLLFPEKRTFFLESSDIFDFGLGLGNSSGSSGDLIPFFSRRIGLLAGREVPLEAGLKIAGREGATNFGALVARTGEMDSQSTDNILGVMRLKRNVLEQSSIGMIASVGDPLGRVGSWTAGADLTYQTSRFQEDKNFLVGVWGLATDREDLGGRRHALGAKIDYPNDLWDIALTYKWVGESFDPSMGFVQRPGAQLLTFNITNTPRPQRPILGLRVRQMTNQWFNTVATDLDGRWESYRVFLAPINWRLENGDRYEVNVVPTGERLVAPFEIAEGVLIPPGSYHWNRFRLEAALASKRKISGQFTWWFGNFYSGTLDEYVATASWKPSPLVIVESNFTLNVGRLAEGHFQQQVVGTRVRLNASPDLQFNSYVQYDNGSDSFGSNTRVRWTFSPLGELFVVYNHNVRELLHPMGTHRGWAFGSNQLQVKLQYAWRY
ncbi:MAG TPA: carbohydrate binding family 9 domain-containing protein [Gemmatimonadaceae bacterium]